MLSQTRRSNLAVITMMLLILPIQAFSDDLNAANNPSTGVYIDEVSLSSLALLSSDFFDLERIEVLKGPQGTMYGRNSTAGALNVVTAKPDLEAFRNLALAFEAGNKGGNAPCILNAANEVAVARFLADEITFLELTSVVEHALSRVEWLERPGLDGLLASDAEARVKAGEYAQQLIR